MGTFLDEFFADSGIQFFEFFGFIFQMGNILHEFFLIAEEGVLLLFRQCKRGLKSLNRTTTRYRIDIQLCQLSNKLVILFLQSLDIGEPFSITIIELLLELTFTLAKVVDFLKEQTVCIREEVKEDAFVEVIIKFLGDNLAHEEFLADNIDIYHPV